MINQCKQNESYITYADKRDEEEKNNLNNSRNELNKNQKKYCKSIKDSETKRHKNIFSIVFPSIKPQLKNKIPILISSSEKYLKIKNDLNNNENIYKSQKHISFRNKANNLYNNSFNRSNNSIDNYSKNNNRTSKNYSLNKANEPNKSYINQIEFTLNIENKNKNKKLQKKFNKLLFNSASSKTQMLRQKLYNKECCFSDFNKFLKKELKMEEKMKLFPYFLERYSPKLIHNKNEKYKNLNINNYINNKNDNKEDYKIKNIYFKNQTIPYVDKIDARKTPSIFPPIIKLGSQYNNIYEKSEESIKKEKFYNEIKQLEKEEKKGKNENKNISKKDILEKLKNKKLIKCQNIIHKNKKSMSYTKDKIKIYFNQLKTSLNQFDDWNDPQNEDNLFNS